MGSEYSAYPVQALDTLRHEGVTRIVGIPLFLSDTDPLFGRVKTHLPTYQGTEVIRWAPAMGQSDLIAQLVLDQVERLSHILSEERLILIGVGAMDETSASDIRGMLKRIPGYVRPYQAFRKTRWSCTTTVPQKRPRRRIRRLISRS